MEICAAPCVGIASVAAVPQPVLKAITASTDVFVCSGLVLAAQHQLLSEKAQEWKVCSVC